MNSQRPPGGTDQLGGRHHELVPMKVVIVSGKPFGAELRIERGSYSVGSAAENDLVLEDTAASHVHLKLEVRETGVVAIDHQSTNGSFLDGTRFTEVELRPGAQLKLGRTLLKVLAASAAAPLAPSSSTQFGALVGESLAMREVFARLERAASSDVALLIEGETGTGKELCAEALHRLGPRASGPYLICDLATIAPSLIESELFGHVRGAFTGATATRAGAFEQASGGTIFLDEVGELPLEVQPRLLRVLERKEVKRVGADAFRTVDIRVIAATRRDLEHEVREGRFREDLFHRLAVVRVKLPPLRERLEDLPLLVDTLLARMGAEPKVLSAEARALLLGYDWPGNVRELRNVVERAVHLGELPHVAEPAREVPGSGEPSAPAPFKEAKERIVAAFERDYLSDLMQRTEGNLSRAAREAGIDRVHLRKLLRKHGLRDAE